MNAFHLLDPPPLKALALLCLLLLPVLNVPASPQKLSMGMRGEALLKEPGSLVKEHTPRLPDRGGESDREPVAIDRAAPRPADLRCEFKREPLGVDRKAPRLSWILEALSPERGQGQQAWQIQVASSPELLETGRADLWDSGMREGRLTSNIPYEGKALQSGGSYYWRVRIRDLKERESAWSEIASWTAGILEASGWKGRWIMDSQAQPENDSLLYGDLPAPLFRKEFRVKKKVEKALLFISGLGYYEASLNGKRIGDQVLDPGWTDYRKRVYYSTYEVSEQLRQGGNCLGVMLGNGWYNPLPMRFWGRVNLREHLVTGQPRFIAQLYIRYADGSSEMILSDESWKASDGPVIRNNVYMGEVYDARKEISGWDEPAFSDASWRRVRITEGPGGRLEAQVAPPIRIAEEIEPVRITETAPGSYLVDMGVNFAGIVRIRAQGKEGTEIRLRYGELLYLNGRLNVMTSVAGQIKRAGTGGPGAPDTAYQQDRFILKGKGAEVFQPRFTFHGFRYVEISGYPGKLETSDITGLRLHSAVESAGSFHCSDSLLNRIQAATRNTFLSNLFSVQSDCPHREKFGYGGDILATAEAYMNNFDMAAFYEKTVEDFGDAARPDGGLTETAPYVGIADEGFGGGSGPIGWGTAHPALIYQLYRYYGNTELLREQYAAAKRWVDLIGGSTSDYLIRHGISDHESIDPKPVALTGTAFYYYNAFLLSRLAAITGNKEDERHYRELSERIREAFLKAFRKAPGFYGEGTQAAQAFALYFDLAPPEEREQALQNLLEALHVKHKGHIATGMFGTPYMLEVLSRHGHAGDAFRTVTRPGFPGWAYMMEQGATSIWEHWAFSDNTFSHNHPMFGSVSEWFFRHLAGIQPAPGAAGYDKILISPGFVDELDSASARHYTVNGWIESKWVRQGAGSTHASGGEQSARYRFEVKIPVNTRAEIRIPAAETARVRESGKSIGEAPGLKYLRREGDYLELEAGSGSYTFEIGGEE